jgi:hypothetical protein
LGPNVLFSTIFSSTLSLLSSLNISDQVPHPYTITGLGLGLIFWYNVRNENGYEVLYMELEELET